MKAPEQLKYTSTHEWAEMSDDSTASIGITDYAQEALGDIVFVGLPEVGDEVVAGETFADVESVKAVSDVVSPVTGTVIEVNGELLDSPEKINEDAFGAWFIKVGDITETEDFLTAAEYIDFAENEE